MMDMEDATAVPFAGVDELHADTPDDPWLFLHDIQQWVKQSMLGEWVDHSDQARAMMEAEQFIEATATAPTRERSDLPETWTGAFYLLGPTEAVHLAPRDGLRTDLLVVNLSNQIVPSADGNIAASSGWVTVSPYPMQRYGPGQGRNSIPPGGSRSYKAAIDLWAIASVAGTAVELTTERHDRGNNDSTSMDAE